MPQLSDEQIHALVREVAHDVVEEVLAQRIAHPEMRGKVTKFSTPDGKTWTSVTLAKGEMLQKILAIMGAIIIATTTLVGFVNRWFLAPIIDERATGIVESHSEAVREAMAQESTKYVQRTEFDRYTAEKQAMWAAQLENNRRIQDTLIELQRDIKELLKRR